MPMGRRAERRLGRQAWQEARQLRAELLAGRCLLPVTNHAAPCESGEQCFGVVPALYSRLVAETAQVAERNTAAAGSAGFVSAVLTLETWAQGRRIRRARRQAQPQWRAHEAIRAAVTDRRLWCGRERGWLQFDYPALAGFEVDLPGRSVTLSFPDIAPLRLWGPWIPWLAVALASQLGEHRLRQPDLSGLE